MALLAGHGTRTLVLTYGTDFVYGLERMLEMLIWMKGA